MFEIVVMHCPPFQKTEKIANDVTFQLIVKQSADSESRENFLFSSLNYFGLLGPPDTISPGFQDITMFFDDLSISKNEQEYTTSFIVPEKVSFVAQL